MNRTLQWTARYLDAWYGISMPELDEEQRSVAASLLALLKGDAAQRALAAWTMGWEPAREISGESWIAPHLAQLLDDPYDAVRFVADRSLRRLPEFSAFEYDFVGDRRLRGTAVERAVDRWRAGRSPAEVLQDPTAVLLDAHGSWDEFGVHKLLAQRDDRSVWLTE